MAKAIWKGAVLAESGDTIVVEGNHYFPPQAINREFFSPEVSALGSPGGAGDVGPVACDHPGIACEAASPEVAG